MITWVQLWPLLAAPSFFGGLVCSIPTFVLKGALVGGGPVRQWIINNFLMPVIPVNAGEGLVVWFNSASVIEEWFAAFFVVLNVNAILLPALFLAGKLIIRVNAWLARVDINQRRNAI